jgi:hypothetical protein
VNSAENELVLTHPDEVTKPESEQIDPSELISEVSDTSQLLLALTTF